MKKFIKKNLSTILLVSVFAVGLSLLLYPTFADWWNQFHATHLIDSYGEAVSKLSDEEYHKELSLAEKYNEELYGLNDRYGLSDDLHEQYERALNVDNSGILGVLKIPSLRINIPIYHGTSESTLLTALGHLEGSSLPIGGENTHTVVSGHRGLPSAKLLTDIDKLEEGDYFMFEVMDETYTYQVDQINIVEPSDYTHLQIEDGKDLATLMTCTPYGINTHRLLVRGTRVDNLPDDLLAARSEAKIIDYKIIAGIVLILILITLSTWSAIWSRHKRKVREKFFPKNK